MKVKFIDYKKDYLRFKKEYDRAWRDVNMRGDLILRKDVEEFEERLAKYVGTKFAVALSSGTDAIYLALKALGIRAGNEVITSAHTFKSTVGAIINIGAKPVLVDMGEDYWDYVTEKTDAVIPCHIAGEITTWKKQSSYHFFIDDACQAFGAIKNPTTSVQCWSFYPAKILGCKGDAGAITTNDEKIYEYIKEARNHFKADNRDFGGNYRMDNLQAALLNIKIQHIDEILERRREIAEQYLQKLIGLGDFNSSYYDDKQFLPNNGVGRVWQDFIIRLEKRNELYEFLKSQGIETMKNEYPFSPEYPKLPLAAKYEAETLRLPCNENLTDREVSWVIKKVKEFYV